LIHLRLRARAAGPRARLSRARLCVRFPVARCCLAFRELGLRVRLGGLLALHRGRDLR
jgi:hypothetical protein